MEIKVDSDTLSLTTKNTAEGLAQALIELAKRFGDASESKTPDGKETLFTGLDWDIRFIGGQAQISTRSQLGWTICPVTHAEIAKAIKVLQGALTEAEGGANSTVQ